MGCVIESLEGRTLFSQTPAPVSVVALMADEKTVVADVTALSTTGSANFSTIQTDLALFPESQLTQRLVKKLAAQAQSADKKILNATEKATKLLNNDVNRVEKANDRLQKSSAKSLQRAFVAATTKLGAQGNIFLNVIQTFVTRQETTNQKNVDAILKANSANAQLSTDVAGPIKTAADAARATLTADLSTTFSTDVNIVIASYAQ